MEYYIKHSPALLQMIIPDSLKALLKYTNDYTFGDLLMLINEDDYIQVHADGDIIVKMRLPYGYPDKDGNDRALNGCVRGEITPEFYNKAVELFGLENVLNEEEYKAI